MLFFFNATPTPEIYTLSLHDALPIFRRRAEASECAAASAIAAFAETRAASTKTTSQHSAHRSLRSEEHTSELQSRRDLVCRLLLEKKKKHLGEDARQQG